MPVTAVVGAQWGDEGKGRIIDYLAQNADMVIRYQGGDNAGHTVVNEHGTFKLHMVPSGIFSPETKCVIGAGTVVNPANLIAEMDDLNARGVRTHNLIISDRAHIVMPYHVALDSLEAQDRLGTTGRGIGPAYADKARRVGLLMDDLLDLYTMRPKLEGSLKLANQTLALHGKHDMFSVDEMLLLLKEWGDRLWCHIQDTLRLTTTMIREGRRILLEGQLGVMRDLDWGTYPYVTSSNPLVGGACAGAGIPPMAISEVIGVVKCYGTSVGAGPFPGELLDKVGDQMREVGQEYGATTGRPRRCAWVDGVALEHAAMLSGFTGLAITKLDVLDDFDEIKICYAYLFEDRAVYRFPSGSDLGSVKTLCHTYPGWKTSTTGCRTWKDLPPRARHFLEQIAVFGQAPIKYVSVGAERDAIITL